MTRRPTRIAVRPLVRDVSATEGLEPALILDDGLPLLTRALSTGGVTVITGAGISTESGIPDYRGPTGRARNATPMHYDEFAASRAAQQRYWARAYTGWARMGEAHPNRAHLALAALQRAGLVDGIITQNVDRLHVAAGSRDVVELHGSLDRVVCLNCRDVSDRAALQERLRLANPTFDTAVDLGDDSGEVRPDGDAALLDGLVARFTPVGCLRCGRGPLKPDVVFFGESVPAAVVEECNARVLRSTSVLVLGSSLAVMSAYRFVRLAYREQVPVVIVNQGPTRGDAQARIRIDARLGDALQAVCERLAVPVEPAPAQPR